MKGSLEEQTRDCKACIYSKNGKCAGTEECHECMWENKFKQKSYNEVEDCISRQAVKQVIIDSIADLEYESENREMQDIIDKLPSVTPKEKTGKWRVQHTETRWIPSDAIFICSQCGHKKSRTDGEILHFCPNCGARMT